MLCRMILCIGGSIQELHDMYNSTKWFKTLHKVVNGEHLFMGKNTPIMVQGKGQIELLFTSGNLLVIRDVYYAPEFGRHLVSGLVLNRLGYKLVFQADRCIIFKNNLFIGRSYLCNNLFKFSVDLNKDVICNILRDLSNEKVDLHYLWHVRLEHVNFYKIAFTSGHDLIPMCTKMSKNYKTCMLNKITRIPFKSVEQKSEILELIRIDFCDFHSTPLLESKKYVITFI